ncbi:MAG: hypothetical protein J7J67_02760, partial [Thermoproteales archaeon]|nr:hypothetical protein [Thermoproteales archaeon]
GTGPFIFADRKPGEYILLKWNPNYWRRHPSKSLSVKVSAQESLFEGQKLEVEISVKDYTGAPSTNASVIVNLEQNGKVAKSATATHQGNGAYKASVDTSGLTGDYTISVVAKATIGGVELERTVTTTVTIKPAWEQYLPYIVLLLVIIIIAVAVFYYMKKKKAEEAEEKEEEEKE